MLDKPVAVWYTVYRKKEREVRAMTNITTVRGYNAEGTVVITITCEYNKRYDAINAAMACRGVAYITTTTKIK